MNKLSIGGWITAPHISIVDATSASSLDWVCLDMEHSPAANPDVLSFVTTVQARNKKAFVRLGMNDPHLFKYPLDSGIDGVIVPMVNSVVEAKLAIERCFYPPKGKRPVGLSRAHLYGFHFEEHMKANLESFQLIVQIEHIDAVDQIESIVALEEVGGVFIGPYDLSSSMDIPGELENPKLLSAIEHVASVTKRSGKTLGAHVVWPDPEKVSHMAGLGYNFIAYSFDTMMLLNTINSDLDRINQFTEASQ